MLSCVGTILNTFAARKPNAHFAQKLTTLTKQRLQEMINGFNHCRSVILKNAASANMAWPLPIILYNQHIECFQIAQKELRTQRLAARINNGQRCEKIGNQIQ